VTSQTGRARTAGFLHHGQSRRRAAAINMPGSQTCRPGLTAASTGTSSTAEEPRYQPQDQQPVYTDTLTSSARSGNRVAIPKTRDGQVEALRILRLTRASAVKARTKTLQLLKQHIVTAPNQLRDRLRDLPRMELIGTCAAWRPVSNGCLDPTTATRIALKKLSRRYLALDEEISDLDALLDGLVADLAPQLIAAFGIGTETAGQLLVTAGDNSDRVHSEPAFAMLCGVAPLPASSGPTQRHRLNRGGDRQANRAIHVIAATRKRSDPRTQAYLKTKTTQGHTRREAIRCLKRLIAREVYYLLPAPHTPPVAPSRPDSRRAAAVKVEPPTRGTTLTTPSTGTPSTLEQPAP
jgi:transposase